MELEQVAVMVTLDLVAILPFRSVSLTRLTHVSVEADPEALTDFVMMFVERDNGRDELQKVLREELAVFCEDAQSK